MQYRCNGNNAAASFSRVLCSAVVVFSVPHRRGRRGCRRKEICQVIPTYTPTTKSWHSGEGQEPTRGRTRAVFTQTHKRQQLLGVYRYIFYSISLLAVAYPPPDYLPSSAPSFRDYWMISCLQWWWILFIPPLVARGFLLSCPMRP